MSHELFHFDVTRHFMPEQGKVVARVFHVTVRASRTPVHVLLGGIERPDEEPLLVYRDIDPPPSISDCVMIEVHQ